MFHLIDAGLRQALVRGIPGLTANDVGFDPPNADWRQRVGVAGRLLINAYLIEFRENRRLRRTEPVRGFAGGSVTETAAPYRVDCHYLVSAWSPAAFGQAVEPTIDEHQLLGDIVTSLDRADPFVFARLFEGLPLPPGTPPELVEHELPLTLLPIEGFPKLVEFWGTMGDEAPAKPVVHLIITTPFFAQFGRSDRRSRRSSPTTGRPERLPARCFTRSGGGSGIRHCHCPTACPARFPRPGSSC